MSNPDFWHGWRWSLLNGYWPEFFWRRMEFEWLPTIALLEIWIKNGEVG